MLKALHLVSFLQICMYLCSLEGNEEWCDLFMVCKTNLSSLHFQEPLGEESNFQCAVNFLTLWLTEIAQKPICFKWYRAQSGASVLGYVLRLSAVVNFPVSSATISGFSAVAKKHIFGLKQFSNSCRAAKQGNSNEPWRKVEVGSHTSKH